MVLYGVLLMLVIWLRPQGLLGSGALLALGLRRRAEPAAIHRPAGAVASSEERSPQPSPREEAGA